MPPKSTDNLIGCRFWLLILQPVCSHLVSISTGLSWITKVNDTCYCRRNFESLPAIMWELWMHEWNTHRACVSRSRPTEWRFLNELSAYGVHTWPVLPYSFSLTVLFRCVEDLLSNNFHPGTNHNCQFLLHDWLFNCVCVWSRTHNFCIKYNRPIGHSTQLKPKIFSFQTRRILTFG